MEFIRNELQETIRSSAILQSVYNKYITYLCMYYHVKKRGNTYE